ncbi:hypothetical protein GGQ22_10155 [Nocardioides sp. zg-579]|uniref:Uncharacterized protein n=1 Tax=Nocardioides marmotae TaxID=2663857 RepID=A0A6I3JBD2_9ACTN|nr:histidine phosphatase family protein [Nocardioides marmotae]MCR6031805.1 hypothetical protein [Gordonia jinghuaiqii]MTB95446.1 hypothetical protein [Nocardioides marmotae]QKE00885.1 histidine phosphatase family protein [Nocardioides marmotae]
MAALFLVRHGRPLVDRTRPAHTWELDPAGFDDVWALRDRLPQGGTWFTSPEPKAVGTAQLLTEGEVGVVADLREQVRDTADWLPDFEATVRRAFAEPDHAAYDGWEPLARTRERVVRSVASILRLHGDGPVVLVGHGTAWALVHAAVTGTEADPATWAGLGMPAVIAVEEPLVSA